MKKLFALALAAALLCGCTAEPPEPTVPTEETTPATEEIVISYDSLEILEFDYADVFAAAPMGDDLLLFSGMDKTTLIKISGRSHKELATLETGHPIAPGSPALGICESGICYATETEYIFLNENLEETERISLPDAWGRAAVSADLQDLYYSTGSQLRVYNRETGLDRLLRDTTHMGLVLESLELDDSILVCRLSDHNAVSPTLFYSTATGELLGQCEISISLKIAGDLWLAKTSDGRRNQIVFGGGDPQTLTGWENFSDVTPVDGGVLIRDAAALRFLDLTARTEAAVALDENAYITNAWNADGILWIALDNGQILRWELADSDMREAVSCIGAYYTRENPDTEGLAALEPVIRQMEDTYGVKIHIFEDATAVQPDGMTLISEYQVDALTAGLEELDLALAPFTPEFLGKAASASGDGRIHISLVRAAEGSGCTQFWDHDGIARIVLPVEGHVQQDFFHGLAHIIDARVMTKTTAFDGWKNLNPKDFSYVHDASASPDISAYPDAFADAIGMISPVEDRASVFTAAMLPDMGTMFESGTMNKKLSTLCTGIRKAFGLQDEILPWEQYLAE